MENVRGQTHYRNAGASTGHIVNKSFRWCVDFCSWKSVMLPSQSSSASSSFSTYRLSPWWLDHCKHRWDNKHPVYASPSTSTSRVTFDPTVVCSLCALWTVQNAIMCVHRVCLLPKMPVYDPSQTKQLENAFSSFFSSFLFFLILFPLFLRCSAFCFVSSILFFALGNVWLWRSQRHKCWWRFDFRAFWSDSVAFREMPSVIFIEKENGDKTDRSDWNDSIERRRFRFKQWWISRRASRNHSWIANHLNFSQN